MTTSRMPRRTLQRNKTRQETNKRRISESPDAAFVFWNNTQLIVRVSGVEWVKLPFFPITVTVNVPFDPFELVEMFRVAPFPLDTEPGVNVAEVRLGSPEMLNVIVLLLPRVVVTIPTDPFVPRLRVRLEGERLIEKSGDGGGATFTVTGMLTVCVLPPTVPVPVRTSV